jgi:cell division septal protein FtsQ
MRDYKNVKVPRRYRTTRRTTATKRVTVGPVRAKKRGGRLQETLVIALSVLITLALCYGAWTGYRWLTSAAIFQVAGVDVKGARRVSDEDIRAIASQFTGQNIFRVDMAGAAREAARNPWVKDVRIERRLPNRISMVFTERAPSALLQAANGRYLMDRDGVVIIPVRESDAASGGLPTVAITDQRAAPGSAVESDALPAAMTLFDELALRGGWDLAAVTVKAGTPETIAVIYGGHEFRLGTGNYPEKLRRLGEIVSDMNRRGLDYSYVELRPERQAAVMVKKENAKGEGAGVKGRRKG